MFAAFRKYLKQKVCAADVKKFVFLAYNLSNLRCALYKGKYSKLN
jgi:hypothetical protein